jgi:glutathione S-transferase
VTTRLYVIPISNAAAVATAMMAYKRIPYRRVELMPGPHPVLVRLAGFSAWTVPALELDGRKVQGSLAISRALDELRPEPPLFPADPERRRAVEEAERWGESVLQPVPRRICRWMLVKDPAMRRWISTEIIGLPAPAIGARVAVPMVRRLADVVGADEPSTRADVARLPVLLDRVDAMIGMGTIGGDQPNAADFQIGASVRVLLEFDDLRHLVEERRCAAVARRLFPHHTGPIPPVLPAEWLPPAPPAPAGQFSEGSAGMVASSE